MHNGEFYPQLLFQFCKSNLYILKIAHIPPKNVEFLRQGLFKCWWYIKAEIVQNQGWTDGHVFTSYNCSYHYTNDFWSWINSGTDGLYMPKWWSNKLYHTFNGSVPHNFIRGQKYRILSVFSTKYDSFCKLRVGSETLADFRYMYSMGIDYSLFTLKKTLRSIENQWSEVFFEWTDYISIILKITQGSTQGA